MDVIDARPWTRPVPEGEGEYGEFFEAAAAGRLTVQQCPSCRHRQFYPRALCTSCGGTPEWLEVEPRGAIHTFTVVLQMRFEPFSAEIPYVVAMVDLDEGVRMLGTVTGVDPKEVYIGQPVVAHAQVFEDDRAVVFWRPA